MLETEPSDQSTWITRARRKITGLGSETARGGPLFFLQFAFLPALIYGAMVLVPLILAALGSLTNNGVVGADSAFVGLQNYVSLAGDPDFRRALGNTILLTIAIIVVPNALGLMIAVLVRAPHVYFRVLRSVFFLPIVLSPVITSFLWAIILTNRGLLNGALEAIGLGSWAMGWLSDPTLALVSVAIVVSWQMVGFTFVIYLAGLHTVPQHLYEAAELDGAGSIRKFQSITWPLLAPAITINTVILLITGLKLYDHVLVLTGGGPGGTTETIAFRIISAAFFRNRLAETVAMAMVLLVLLGLSSAVVLHLLRRREVELL